MNLYTRLVILPEREVYNFSRKLFFYAFNTEKAPFISKLTDDNMRSKGYAVHTNLIDNTQYYKMILLAEKNHKDDLYSLIEDKKNIRTLIIITDNPEEFLERRIDDVVDVSKLLDYYNATLSFETFSNYILSDIAPLEEEISQ